MRFREVTQWCEEQFGPPDESLGGLIATQRWTFNAVKYAVVLRHEADAMFFRIRWC